MSLYKITIKLLSPIITPLKGDTIWGHIVWGIANYEGDNAVAEFLERQKSVPEIVVSSAFPAGYLCRPLPLPKLHKGDLSAEEYYQIKKDKKRKLVKACECFGEIPFPANEFECAPFVADVSIQNMIDLKNHRAYSPISKNTTTHNTIDRASGTVLDGGLYSVEESWAKQNEFDIYAESALPPERIETLFSWAFENGFGADSSTGKGKIEVVSNSIMKVTPKYNTNTYMALAPFVGTEKIALENLRADTFTRSGRLGGGFSESVSPFKKTVVLFDEGAVFDCKEKITYCGKLIENVHSDKRICQAGFAPVIPIPEEMNKRRED